jgi:galactokinase
MLCARPNQVCQYAYCPVRFERAIPVPAGHTFAVGVSGVVAEKTGGAQQKYNRASRLVSAIMDLWCRETGRDDPNLAAVLAGSREDVARLRMFVETAKADEFEPAALSARLDHFVAENEQILPAAGDALARGDLAEFGRLVDASQRAAENLLGNQIPQTSYLATAARRHGAAAASAFGAGFGGGVWAMVEAEEASSFLSAWADAYRQKFPQNAAASTFFTTAAGPATFRVC